MWGAAALSAVLVLAGAAVVHRPARAQEERAADSAPDFAALWAEARRWAAETRAVPEDCVFTLRLDARTRRAQTGYSVTCDEPFRSPFYPWPEPARPGIRFTADEVERYGRAGASGPGAAGRPVAAAGHDPLEACDLVVGFTEDGQGAEAIECYRQQGNVLGQRANTEFVVEAANGRRVVSRLYERVAHLRDPAMKKIRARLPQPDAEAAERPDGSGGKEAVVQIDGKVIGLEGHRVRIRGRALPLFGGSSADKGVVLKDANIVVQYPDDDALRPGYYYGGEHCFKDRREIAHADGRSESEWVYGPCTTGPDEYWAFEHYPPGRRTVSHGPYREYGACDADRKVLKAARPGVAGHCVSKRKVIFRMTRDGSLVVPKDAPPIE